MSYMTDGDDFRDPGLAVIRSPGKEGVKARMGTDEDHKRFT